MEHPEFQKIDSLPINAKLACKFEHESWIIGHLVRSSLKEYSLVDKNHITRHRFQHEQYKALYEKLYVLVQSQIELPTGLSIVNRDDIKELREIASFRISRQGAVMRNRVYCNEVKVPIGFGNVVAKRKDKKQNMKMSSTHDYLVVVELKSSGNGIHTRFRVGNPYVGTLKNWYTENDLWFVSDNRKLVGTDLDDFFESNKTGSSSKKKIVTKKTIRYKSKKRNEVAIVYLEHF